MATAFLVHTRLSWGKTCDYLIANDVEPGLMHRYETREDWQEVILDALINVPLAPYLPSGQPIPPIGTAIVVGVEAVDPSQVKENVQRTRSQFIMATIWKKQSALKNYNFLHHDYDKWTQKQIWADVDYWCDAKKHPVIDLITKWRCARQYQRLRAEEK